MPTRMVIPSSSEELAEFITDRKKVAEVFNNEDPTVLPEFLTNYAHAVNKADKDIQRQVDEGVERAMASFLRENHAEFRKPVGGKELRAINKMRKATASAYSDKAPGAELNGKYETLVDFLKIIDNREDPRNPEIARARAEMDTAYKNAMSSTDPAAGGFLIPEEFRATLLELALETAVVRPRATVIPMASLRASMPMLDVTSHESSVYGGVIAYWTEEGVALTQSQPNFGQITLEAKKLTAYTEVPSELVQDSAISVDAFIGTRFPRAVANFEDRAFFAGTGVGEPLGWMTAGNSALISQAKESGQAADTIVWENVIKMYARMLPESLGNAVWVTSPNTFPELATMALSVGTGGSAVWLQNGASGPPMTILGRPVIVTEKAAKLGDAFDLSFVDFSYYLIGDRMAMTAKSSTEYKFGEDKTAYRVIERLDGRPWLKSAVTPQNGGDTLSPFVSLAERA